ncbi:MAG TPA: hypothetical protein ENJ34_02895 [Epsilonproteobacteria bacterium]|nr:hypothetical protein [Campylobacterota bacterium]
MKNKKDTFPSLTNELKFLIVCCQTNPFEEEIAFIQSFMQNNQSLITVASQHGILPVVYKSIKKQCPTQNIQHWQSAYQQIAHRNMLMTSELIKIIHLLQKNNIQALSFKGPTLSQSTYGDITLRQYGDIDILIQEKDRSRMVLLMKKHGYIPEIALKKETEETFFHCVNVLGFHHPRAMVHVEIHWALLSTNYAITWDEATLWTQTSQCTIGQYALPTLTPEALLLYLCTHSAKHLFERLEWICDIERSIRAHKTLNWEYLLLEAEKMGIRRILFLSLSLTQELFALKLPHDVEKLYTQDAIVTKLTQKIIRMHFCDISSKEKSPHSFFLLLAMRENVSDKLRFTYRALFSPKYDDFVFIQLPKKLSFLYLFIRPYRLIKKYYLTQK